MLGLLPPELTIIVLSTLDIPHIHRTQLLSKQFDALIRTNEPTIYRNAAFVHGFISSSTIAIEDLEEKAGYSYRILDGLNGSWKTFCQRRLQRDRSWHGKAPSNLVQYPATGCNAHRIKLDEKKGLLICSTGFFQLQPPGQPALIVADMKNPDRVLWGLSSLYIKEFAHVEYENGYLIFDRIGGQKEVWRLASIPDPHPSELSLSGNIPVPYAQKDQLSASLQAAAAYSHTYPNGHFVPHALLATPEPSRAFRFVYPTLLVGGYKNAFCFDVPSRRLVQTIKSIQQPTLAEGVTLDQLELLMYVEVSAKHVFLCGTNSLRVFSRETGGCIFDLSSKLSKYGDRTFDILPYGHDASDEDVSEDRNLSFEGDDDDPKRREEQQWSLIGVDRERRSVLARLKVEEVQGETGNQRVLDNFTAVHVSPCGKHLVAMLRSSRMVLIRDFASITHPGSQEEYVKLQRQNIVQINMGIQSFESRYLVYEKGRVLAISTAGIFILDVDQFFYPSPSPVLDEPLVKVYRIPEFNDFPCLDQLGCAQLTESGIYFTWDALRMRVHKERWILLPSSPSNVGSGVYGPNGDDLDPYALGVLLSSNRRTSTAMDVDPELDPLEENEWVPAVDPGEFYMPGVEEDLVLVKNDVVKKDFFRVERSFRKVMEIEGRFGLTTTGDFVMLGTPPMSLWQFDEEHEEEERDMTVCGVDFAVWD